jgi:hypothetical protein
VPFRGGVPAPDFMPVPTNGDVTVDNIKRVPTYNPLKDAVKVGVSCLFFSYSIAFILDMNICYFLFILTLIL